MANNALTGAWGEHLAAEYLRKKGYRLAAQNYRIRGGEIDLIAENRRYVVFVEVKTRQDSAFGEAREFVDGRKQERIRMAAVMWLSEHETEKQPRFDVVEVYAPQGTATAHPKIIHLENAF